MDELDDIWKQPHKYPPPDGWYTPHDAHVVDENAAMKALWMRDRIDYLEGLNNIQTDIIFDLHREIDSLQEELQLANNVARAANDYIWKDPLNSNIVSSWVNFCNEVDKWNRWRGDTSL